MTHKAEQDLKEKILKDSERIQEIDRRTKEGVRKSVIGQFKDSAQSVPYHNGGMRAIFALAKKNTERFEKDQRGDDKFQNVDELKVAIASYWDFLESAAEQEDYLIADLEGLCQFIGVSRKTLMDWERQNYNGFGPLISETRTAIAACNKQIAKKGKMPPLVFMSDFNNNHEYVQKQQVQIETNQLSQEKMTPQQLEDTFSELNLGPMMDADELIDDVDITENEVEE